MPFKLINQKPIKSNYQIYEGQFLEENSLLRIVKTNEYVHVDISHLKRIRN